jgi:hypothetical protein
VTGPSVPGLGFDALTLAAPILTWWCSKKTSSQSITRLLGSEPMASPGAACLTLAWHHRAALLTG